MQPGIQHGFVRVYPVRYDECNPYGYVTPAGVLLYLQDIAGLHAAEVKILEGGVWIARRTMLDFTAPVPARATVEITTGPLGYSKVQAQRGYEVRIAGQPDPAITGRTIWVFLSLQGRPIRLPENFFKSWASGGSHPLLPDAPWPTDPPHPPFVTTSSVRFSDLDMINHMNNAAYVELLDDAAWERLSQLGISLEEGETGHPVPLHYDIEYLASVRFGDKLTVQSWFELLTNTQTGQLEGYERWQKVWREDTLIVRARSRWGWSGVVPDSLRGL